MFRVGSIYKAPNGENYIINSLNRSGYANISHIDKNNKITQTFDYYMDEHSDRRWLLIKSSYVKSNKPEWF